MTQITITGNVGSAELKFTPSGQAVLNLSVAVNHRRKSAAGEWEDAGTDWHRVALWGPRAEAAVDVAVKGARVIVLGRLKSREYEHDGAKRTAWEITATEIGVIAKAEKANRAEPANDPWGAPDAPPF